MTTNDCEQVKDLDFCHEGYTYIDITQDAQYMIVCCATSITNINCTEYSDPSTDYTTQTWSVTISPYFGYQIQPRGLVYAPNGSKAYMMVGDWGASTHYSMLIELEISSDRSSVSYSKLTHDTETSDPEKITIDPSGEYLFFVRRYAVYKIEIKNPTITIVAGGHTYRGHVDGLGTSARFWNPDAIAMQDTGTLWIGEDDGNRIRQIHAGSVTTGCLTVTNTTPAPTTTTTTPTPTTTNTTPAPTKTVMAHQEYYKQCPSNSNTLGAGKNRLQDCLCAENYFRNSSDFCVPCAYGYQKQDIGNFNCSCYVFDSCDPPVCNGDGSSCRPLLVVSESDGGGFGLSEVLVGEFEDLSLTDTIDIEAETAKQGFEFTSDGSQLISGTSIATTQVVNGTTKTSITNVILRQNRLTDEVQIKIIPVQNEAIKATAVSPIDDNVLVFGGERNVYMYDENEEKLITIASVEDDNMQTVDVSTSDAQGGRIAIAYSLDFFNTSNSSISRRRLLQDATSDLCGSVEHFTANFVSETNARSYKICQPHSVALYTSGDTNVDYILVGTPCRIVRINLDRTGNAKYAKTLLGPGEPDQNCQEGDFGDASSPVSGIRFQDARKILVDKSGGEIFVFDKNHLRKIAMKEDQVSGITTVETFADEDIDSITNMALSPDDGSILFARNQEVQITVNASTGAQQPRLENKLQRLDLVKPKESRNGLYCFSEENRVNSQVTCESNQDNVAKGLLCKSGVPCVCLNGYYLKDNKCEKCRVEDG